MLVCGLVLGACAAEPLPVARVARRGVDEPKLPTAEAIVREMLATYASASSYEDVGEVTVRSSGARPFAIDETFTTAFVRTIREFRFEFHNDYGPSRDYVIWSAGDHTFSRWNLKDHTDAFGTDLGGAVAGATGVSLGAANTVPAMLMPDRIGGGTFTFYPVTLLGSATVDQHACWQVAYTTNRRTTTVAIDRDAHVIRRMVMRDDLGNVSTTTYQPVLGQPVATSKLRPISMDADLGGWVGVAFMHGTTHVHNAVVGSPAALAGVREHDVILEIDGVAVADDHAVDQTVRNAKVGAKLRVKLRHAQGDEVDLAIIVADPRKFTRDQLLDKPAPGFVANVITGAGSTTLYDLAGHVVVVGFWMTDCKECQAAIAKLSTLDKWRAQGLRVIGLISDKDFAVVRQFAVDHRITYAIGYDAHGLISQQYFLQTLPGIIVIDKQGVVRYVDVAGSLDDLDAVIAKLL